MQKLILHNHPNIHDYVWHTIFISIFYLLLYVIVQSSHFWHTCARSSCCLKTSLVVCLIWQCLLGRQRLPELQRVVTANGKQNVIDETIDSDRTASSRRDVKGSQFLASNSSNVADHWFYITYKTYIQFNITKPTTWWEVHRIQ